MRPTRHLPRHLAGCGLLLTATLTSGCATKPTPPATPPVEKAASYPMRPAPEYVPVVRYGRYTLVELAPGSAQQDLLLQVVDIAIPDTRKATVGDALRHVLLRSGYQLCASNDVTALNALPLPAAHYRLGPVLLRDALLTLVGPAWDLGVDDRARRICIVRAGPPVVGATAPRSSAAAPKRADHVERRPLTTEARR